MLSTAIPLAISKSLISPIAYPYDTCCLYQL
ncbi:hypothetical protein M3J09_004569 [Ascochyta lentis]